MDRSLRLTCGILLAVLSVVSRAGEVQTLDGKSYRGQLQLDEGGIRIGQTDAAVKVAWTNLASLRMTEAPTTAPATRPTTAPAALPAPWRGQDIGLGAVVDNVNPASTNPTGSGAFIDDAFHLSTPARYSTTTDAGYFVYQTLKGDGHLIARVAGLDGLGMTSANLAVRTSLEDDGAAATLRAPRRGTVTLRGRYSPGGGRGMRFGRGFGRDARSGVSFPIWLRLVREGDTLAAYTSEDGRAWDAVGSMQFTLPEEAYIGLSVGGDLRGIGIDGISASATFDHVRILPGRGQGLWHVNLDAPEPVGDGTPVLQQGAILRNGCAVVGTVKSLSTAGLRLSSADGKSLDYPLTDVARIVFHPMLRGVEYAIPADQAGVLLQSGDFLAGEVKEMRGQSIVIDSVLFGQRALRVDTEVATLCLARVLPGGARYRLRCRDGSVLMATALSVKDDCIVVDDLARKVVRVPLTELYDLVPESSANEP